jgi:hypothetical protein
VLPAKGGKKRDHLYSQGAKNVSFFNKKIIIKLSGEIASA